MARPRKQEATPAQPASPSGELASAAPPSTPPPPAEEFDRVELRIGRDGKLQPMRDENREKLRRALERDPDFLGPGYQPPTVARFVDEAFAGRMLDGLSVAQAFVFGKVAKVPYEKARGAMGFDGEEKKSLAPPVCVLLNHYGGAWLARHGALVEFGAKLAVIEASKIDKAVSLAREQKKNILAPEKKEDGQ